MYGIVIAACVAIAFSKKYDFKSRFVLLQLPIALQCALLDALGLTPYLARVSWLGTYALLGLPTFAFLYLVGWFIDILY